MLEEFSSRVLSDMNTGVLVLSAKGTINYANPAATGMLELSEGFETGVTPYSLILSDQKNDEFSDYVIDAVHKKDMTHTGVIPFTAPSGRKYVFRVSSSFIRPSVAGDPPEIALTFSDETTSYEMRRKFVDSSRCFAVSIFGLCLWTMIYALWEMMHRPISVDFLTHGTEIMGLIMMVFIFKYTSFTRKDLGITTDQPKKTLITALIVSAVAVVFLILAKAVARLIDPNSFEPAAPFVDWSRFGWRQITYILVAGLQEFVARSVMQTNIRRIMVGKHPAAIAIVLSSLMFAALHIQHGFIFMLGAGILGGLEGILYEKQQNIFGVWILHWVFGVAGTLLCLVKIVH